MKKDIKVFDNVLQLIGKTPLIKLNTMTKGFDGDFFAKVEAFNPGHSSKDRIALHIIEEAERKGILSPGDTIIETTSPNGQLMTDEFFGPILSIFTYEEAEFENTLKLCDNTSHYGLTGAIFAKDIDAVKRASNALRFAAGNFYINDKPTGAVVGQQPFGGARSSGTNDKAGSAMNLMRWTSPRTIKETLIPPNNPLYPHMA